MNILVDENIPNMTVSALAALGHDVRDLRRTELEGSSDAVLWTIAQSERRVLVSTDKGFARRRNQPHSGILIVRLRQPSRQRIHERVIYAVEHTTPSDWSGLLVIVRDVAQSVWRRSAH